MGDILNPPPVKDGELWRAFDGKHWQVYFQSNPDCVHSDVLCERDGVLILTMPRAQWDALE